MFLYSKNNSSQLYLQVVVAWLIGSHSTHKHLEKPIGKTGYRRIRGAAGSGKTMVLAHKAAKLMTEGKSVLVLTFNITLVNYIRS